MTSAFVNFRNKVEKLFSEGLTALEAFLQPIEKELAPIAEKDLKEVAQAGLAAGLAAVTSGGSLTLDVAEIAAVAAGRAIVTAAAAKGAVLTTQAGLALAAAAHLATQTTTTVVP